MKNKTFYIIISVLVLAIALIFSYIIINKYKMNKIGNNISLSVEEKEAYDEYNNILKTDDSTVITVNGEEISNRDIELTKYLWQEEETDKARELTIKNKVVLQKLKIENVTLNEEKEKEIEGLVEELKSNSELEKILSTNKKNQIIEELSKNLYNNALINQFKTEFINQIANKTFKTEDKSVLEEYQKCLKVQNEWEKQEKIEYSELVEAREAVYNAYIQKLINESKIE